LLFIFRSKSFISDQKCQFSLLSFENFSGMASISPENSQYDREANKNYATIGYGNDCQFFSDLDI